MSPTVHRPHPRRRELDRERDAVEATTQLRQRRDVVVAERGNRRERRSPGRRRGAPRPRRARRRVRRRSATPEEGRPRPARRRTASAFPARRQDRDTARARYQTASPTAPPHRSGARSCRARAADNVRSNEATTQSSSRLSRLLLHSQHARAPSPRPSPDRRRLPVPRTTHRRDRWSAPLRRPAAPTGSCRHRRRR